MAVRTWLARMALMLLQGPTIHTVWQNSITLKQIKQTAQSLVLQPFQHKTEGMISLYDLYLTAES